MFRLALLVTMTACVAACTEAPPAPRVDGAVIENAVQLAQARADAGRRGREAANAATTSLGR